MTYKNDCKTYYHKHENEADDIDIVCEDDDTDNVEEMPEGDDTTSHKDSRRCRANDRL